MIDHEKEANDPSTTSAAYQLMAPRWHKLATLLAGTEAMRDAGEKYLPRHPAESIDAYNERLSVTVLFNLTGLTLKSWVGRPFSDDVDNNDDVPDEIAAILNDNLDLQGNDIDVFARRWFEKGLAKAFCHVLVDFPRRVEREDGTERTLEDDRKENLHPYWVLIEPENLIFAHAEIHNGEEVLDHVRIMEYSTRIDGYTEVVVRRIRVLTPGHVQLLEERKDPKSDAVEWIEVADYDLSVDVIPLVTFYADREGFMVGKPPLLDLADLNISHWQSSSDQRSVLTVARFPILACSGGVQGTDKLEIGPNKWLVTEDPAGKFYYVEHTGKAIQAGRQDLLDLEDQMANYGAEFLRRKPGNPTATARALDSAESTSPLMDVTGRFMDALDTALKYTAMWMGLEDGGKLGLETDFGPEEAVTADYQALIAAHKARAISRNVFNAELVRRGTLAEDFDAEKNEKELEEEAGAFSGTPIDNTDVPPEVDPEAEE